MKRRTFVKDLKDHIGEEVLLQGFADTIRAQSKIAFVILRDFSGKIQAVVLNDCPDFEKIKELSEESVIEIKGLVKKEEQAPNGYEVEVGTVNILSHAFPELPIPVNIKKGGEETNINTRFDNRWIDLRKSNNAQMIKVWNSLEKGLRRYYDENGYTQFYSPSFMSTPSESGAEVFEVKYFDRKEYLAQSPQFYKQMAIASGFEKVFSFGPVFRAEESFTTRHMTEFTGWDFEIGFIESHEDVMAEEEQMIISAFTKLSQDLPELFSDEAGDKKIIIPEAPFPKITMDEAKKKLVNSGTESKEPNDMSPEEEREIAKIIKKETGSDFLFVTDYHKSVRPFYHMRREDNPELTKSADLLFRGLEITTLAQREHRPEILEDQAKEKGMPLDSLEDYFRFFKYGCPPHGGGGIGANRLVMKVVGFENVKEATFLPRDVNRLKP